MKKVLPLFFYADNVNITSIDGVGTLIYGGGAGVSPYEVTGLTPEPGQPAYRQRAVTYNTFDRPETIAEGAYTSGLVYDADGDRVRMYVSDTLSGPFVIRYYIGGRYEYDLFSGTERLYLGGDAYSAPMVLIKSGAGGWTPYQIGRDYLGSITDISDLDGQSFQVHYRYDPWGRLVDNSSGQPYAPGSEPTLLLGRGYTGHEYLPWFGLINANARLYDPLLGRFLSPDPYVQDPDFSQNYNRYSYCLNNPLKYTDESGGVVGTTLAIAALIGGISNWLANGAEFSWKGLGYYWVGLHVGVFSALTGDWIAGLTKAAGVWAGALVGATTGAMTGAATSTLTTLGNNLVSGNSLDYGLGRAALSGALGGALSGAFSGAIKGYQYAKENGADPWTRNYMDDSDNGPFPDYKPEKYEATSSKTPVKQPDKRKYCYAYANEFADQGHYNHTASDFLEATDWADGYDPMDSYNLVCKTTGKQVRVSDKHWRSLGYYLANNAEVQSSTFNHAVNVRGITIGYKLNSFGGGIGNKLHLFSVYVHDPLIGGYRYYYQLLNVGIIKY